MTQEEGTAVTPSGSISKDAKAIAKEMYPGWNLGNTLEASGNGLSAETAWQPTQTTQAVLDAVKAAGFKSVRIPCSWDIHSVNGTIDAAWMARVKQVVERTCGHRLPQHSRTTTSICFLQDSTSLSRTTISSMVVMRN